MLRTSRMPDYLRLAMLAFAERVMERPPDFVLGGYMERWHASPRGAGANAYIHRFHGSDSDRALHDHPYDSVTCLLSGNYVEHFHVRPLVLPAGNDRYATTGEWRQQGDVIERPATTMHRVEVVDSNPVVTLFFVGSRAREWGFLTPKDGWIKWSDYERAYEPQIKSQEARVK